MSQSNAKRSWKAIAMTLTLVFALVITGCGSKNDANEKASEKTSGNVIAKYDGGEITKEQFDKEASIIGIFEPQAAQMLQIEQFREYFLDQTIAYHYLTDKATDKAKEEGKAKATENMAKMKEVMGGEEQFKKMLDAQKVTEADLIDYTTRILTVAADVNAKVTEDQIKAEFEKVKGEMTTASVRHILVALQPEGGKERTKEEALKLAKEYQARLKKGEDFAKLASKVTDDGGSKGTGGLYADANVNQWVPEFKEAALTLKLNEISEPVETQFGYHVMRVEKRTEKTYETLTAEEKEMVRASAAMQIMDKFMKEELPKIIKEKNLPPLPKPEEPKVEEPKAEQPSGEQPKAEQPADNKDANTQGEADKPAAGTEANKPAEEDKK